MDRDDDVDDDVSLLVVVLETNSQFWFPRSRKQRETTTPSTPSTSLYAFEKVCKDIAAFSSAYLACNRANRIAVVAAHARKECTFLFRSHLEGDVVLEDEEDEGDKEGDNTKKTKKKKKKRKKPPTNPRMTFVGDDECDDIGGFANDAQDVDALDISKGLEPLQTTFRRAFFDGLKALSDENDDVNYDDDDDDDENREQQHATPIAGAISLALTYANRIERDPSLRGRVKSRVLVVQASEDDAEQYVPMMNAMFAAQSSNILIDCLCLNEKESSFLQQAAFVSGGIYAKPEKSKKGGGEETREDLLERALCSFLPDRYTRRFLRPPRAGSIDFRSSCFCHGNRISKGFVCSVCLSVFCEKEGSCQTCGAAFV
jgi:transcription initiation factor TFIIH subunit 3